MHVEQLMTKPPQSCQPGDTLSEAAQIMWNHGCGCLPVTSGAGSQGVVGMITDRDICMAAKSEGKPLHELHVGDAMAKDVRACHPGDSPREAEFIMWAAGVRRLPVLDEAGQLLGLLSLTDLAREAARQYWRVERQETESEVGVLLSIFCQPQAIRRPASEN
jgi:CBS domain-containing protein